MGNEFDRVYANHTSGSFKIILEARKTIYVKKTKLAVREHNPENNQRTSGAE